jgi:methanogenic corrinoid protein MtbC1
MQEKTHHPPDDAFNLYLSSLIKGNRDQCLAIIEALMHNGEPIVKIYVNYFQRSLYNVGRLWEENKISVAAEHVATAITETLLARTYPRAAALPKHGRRAVVACVTGERHQIGSRMVADILELRGWDSHYLGADTPKDALLDMLLALQPELLGLSVSLSSNIDQTRQLFREALAHRPTMLCIVGGQGVVGPSLDLGDSASVPVISNIQGLESYLRQHADA